MNYNYSKLKDTWACERGNTVEGYEEPIVRMSLPEWNQYVAEGKNVMYPAIKSGQVRGCPYCGKVGGCSCSGKRGPNPFFGGCGCGGRMIF